MQISVILLPSSSALQIRSKDSKEVIVTEILNIWNGFVKLT